jgi:hypothetical protein
VLVKFFVYRTMSLPIFFAAAYAFNPSPHIFF